MTDPPPPSAASDPEDAKDRILVVDDVPINRDILCAVLDRDYTVVKASSGTEALALAGTKPFPDLILLDVEMPDLDGYEVLSRLKACPETHDILPVVFVTAATEVEDETKGLALGAIDYMPKPIKPAILRARVRNHINLRKAQKSLADSQKMDALGHLVAGVAHEINTPVGIALTSASYIGRRAAEVSALLAEGKLGKTALEGFLADLGEGATLLVDNLTRAAALIKSFKLVSVDQVSERRRKLDLAAYLGDVVASLGPELRRRKVSVAIEAPAPVTVETCPGVIAQILSNLILNALQHAFDGDREGSIRIEVRPGRDGSAMITHADDGKGIPPAVLGHIFEPFFTTARGKGGSGLGLSIIYNLVTERLGGSISVTSEEGRGTTFIVRFPPHLVSEPPAPADSDVGQRPSPGVS